MHFSVFIPIHHSFGFFDIFLEGGGLETPKTPLDPPLMHAVVSILKIYIHDYLTIGVIRVFRAHMVDFCRPGHKCKINVCDNVCKNQQES